MADNEEVIEKVTDEQETENIAESENSKTEKKPTVKVKKAKKDEIEKLKEEFEAYKNQHLRVLAEYDNFRKRTVGEKAAIYSNAVADAVKLLLPVADNIDRALAQESATEEDMRKGVEMIQTQFLSSFEQLGIQSVGVIGEAFNPELHDAVSHIDDEALGENVISQVFQKGYAISEKVIRHAVVQVAN